MHLVGSVRGSLHQTSSPLLTVDMNSLSRRVPSRQCREELQEIYCSFLYHDKGLCLPPFLVAPGQVRIFPTIVQRSIAILMTDRTENVRKLEHMDVANYR